MTPESTYDVSVQFDLDNLPANKGIGIIITLLCTKLSLQRNGSRKFLISNATALHLYFTSISIFRQRTRA